MARPTKTGLEYFPMDVDFFEDEKILAIGGEFGVKGEMIAVRLLCAIYRNGYFVLWNDLIKNKLLRTIPGMTADLLEQVVNRLVKWGFFYEPLFSSDKVLTSNGIQKRFKEATKRRKEELLSTYWIQKPATQIVYVDNNPESKRESKREITKVGSKLFCDGKDISIAVFDSDECKAIYMDETYLGVREQLSSISYLRSSDDLESWIDKFNIKQKLNPQLRPFNDWLNHLNNWLPRQNKSTTGDINDQIRKLKDAG